MGLTPDQINHPDNFQVLPRILNVVLSNLTDESATAIIPLITAQFNIKD
jgi:hypothetical protein